MKKYLNLDLADLKKDLAPFIQPEHLKLHLMLHKQAMDEIERNIDVYLTDLKLYRKMKICKRRT